MKTQLLFFVSIFFLFCSGCKSDRTTSSGSNNTSNSKSIIDGVDLDQKIESRGEVLADMSQLVPIEDISKALGIEASKIKKVPNSSANVNTCFFKWDDPNFPNTGIMMQIKTNPYPLDLPEWALVSMSGLRDAGESALGQEFNHRYKELNGMATEGLYNSDIGKYYWRLSDKVVLFLAFNTIHEQEEQFEIATEIGSQMIKNYLDI